MTSTRFALGCIGAFLTVAACGGSSGIDLFSNPDGGGGSSGEGGASSSSGSSGGTSGANGDSGTGREGGTASGGTQPGGDTKSIPCGDAACALDTQVCCLTTNSGSGQTFACVNGTTCPAPPGGGGGGDNPSVAIKCTGAANCAAGTVCCVTRTDTAVTSSCAASCTGDQAQLCDPNATTTGCSPSLPCSSDNIREWRLPRSFATCGGKGD